MTKSSLRVFLEALDLARSGSKEEQVESILAFLLQPQDSGKVCVVQEAALVQMSLQL